MADPPNDPKCFVGAIKRSGLTIYDPIEVGDPVLWIPAPELEALLDKGLRGISLVGLPLRTRSKVVKEHVCRVLGYPVPPSFRRTKPRFPGQSFDTYVQKSNNLQVWNEQLVASRRYVLVRVTEGNVINRVKIVSGATLAELDTTGTLTQKYQARCNRGKKQVELIVAKDTNTIWPFVNEKVDLRTIATPVSPPQSAQLLPISILADRLSKLIGSDFADIGYDQERNRGAALHRLVCKALGYLTYKDGNTPPVCNAMPSCF